MATPSAIETSLESLGDSPRRVVSDGQSVEERSVEELIMADEYLEAKKRSRAGGTGMRMLKINSGGTRGT